MRKLGLIAAVVGGLVAYASAQTTPQGCADRDWATMEMRAGQPTNAPVRNVTFCVRGVLITADEMEVIATDLGRRYALRGTVTMTVPDPIPAK